MVVLLLLVTCVTLMVGYLTWSYRKRPPGPWGLPILGYLPWINPLYPYRTFTDLAKKYGEIFGIQMGGIYTVVLTNPKTIRSVFMKDATTGRAPLYLTHGIMKGYGIICSEGELWKDQRKFVHAFLKLLGASRVGQQRNKLECIIKEYISQILLNIEHAGSNTAIPPLKLLSHSLGSLINRIVFGRSWPEDDPTWIWLQKVQEEGVQLMGVAGPLNFLSFLRHLPKYKNIMKFLTNGQKKTHNLYMEIIKDEMDLMNNSSTPLDVPNNLIQAFLLERQKKTEDIVEKFYNDQQFVHLLADIFGAALDTTVTTMLWFLLYIAKYQNVQEKLHQEINEVLQGREPCLEDMSHMTIFAATLNEIFRIRPVVPLGIPHAALQDLEIGDYKISKGTMIVPLIWAIHMDDKIWPNPEHFNPWRFIDNEGKLLKSDNLMPFQSGKRMCVGDEFARMTLFLYLVSILQTYRIELAEPEKTDFIGVCGLTMSPKPFKLLFHRES